VYSSNRLDYVTITASKSTADYDRYGTYRTTGLNCTSVFTDLQSLWAFLGRTK